MFEKYTESARRVIFFARYEASQLGANQIGTEHLLLGIIRQSPEIINHVFGKEKRETLRKEVEDAVPKRNKISTSVDMMLTPSCKRVLTFAGGEAVTAGDEHITPEHLLLGLTLEPEGVAAAVLRSHDLSYESLRKRLNLSERQPDMFYCPKCARARHDPLTCGDCSAVICRVCGTPLESPDELGIG